LCFATEFGYSQLFPSVFFAFNLFFIGKKSNSNEIQMAQIIRMPRMTDTMEEGVIANWLVKVGENLKTGKAVAEVETDKATMELENYEEGVLLHSVPAGATVKVNFPVYIVGKSGEDIAALLTEFSGGAPATPQLKTETPPAAQPLAQTFAKPDLSAVKAVAFRMPLKTDTMTEGVIAKWLVKVGDKIKSGMSVAEVETDKATMELECYEEGYVLYLAVKDGEAVPVNGIAAIIGEQGADFQAILNAEKFGGATQAAPAAQNTATAPLVGTPAHTPAVTSGGRIFISPLAKKLAAEKGLDIKQIRGSGENGRITKKDVETFVPQTAAQPAAQAQNTAQVAPLGGGYRDEKVSQMRKVIAKRLTESKNSAPHFYLTVSINMDAAMEARKRMNEISKVKISFNDMVIKACAVALRQHPSVNSSWQGDFIRYYDYVNVGVAVAVEDGLLVPVIRNTDQKSLSQIAGEVKGFAQKAKEKKLQPSDWEGNTFTISNLGMFGIEEFTAIVNPPDACILAVGAIQEMPVVKNGQIAVGNIMKVTLSCDHRVVDGAVGSPFLQTLKSLLEDPIRLLI
jgi:pyruvate dehydrogenase E2 component (dihydrolipoamide acetyltransferase)